MKTNKVIIMFVILVVLIIGMVSAAMAGRGCGGADDAYENYIEVDKTAPGTKYNATLTIYYADGAACGSSSASNTKNMHFFVRMEGNLINADHYAGGSELVPFAGVAECIPYWNGIGYTAEEAAVLQQQAIMEFFRLNVNPWIYFWKHPEDPDGCDPNSSDPDLMCPPFAVKSVNSVVEDIPTFPDLTSDLLFTIMDLVIAIVD